METKVCKSCGEEKRIIKFKQKTRKDGSIYITPKCSICYVKEQNSNYREFTLDDVRTCERCKTEKPLISFSPNKRKNGTYTKGGRHCNTCRCVLTRIKKHGVENRRYSPYLFSEKIGQELKICSICKTAKPLSDFYKSKARKSRNPCIECEKIVGKKYNEKRIDKLKIYEKERNAKMSLEEKQKRRESNKNRWRSKTPEQKKERYDRNRKSIMKSVLTRRGYFKSCDFIVLFTKFDIIKRDGLNCYLCNKLLTIETVTLDHIIPLYRGGQHKPENTKIACRNCNSSKSKKLLTEFKKLRGDYDYLKQPKLKVQPM